MNRIEILEKMIEYKDISVNENLDYYCEYLELFDESLDEEKELKWIEIELIIESFSNKTDHPYLLGILEDCILMYADKNPDKLNELILLICQNRYGLYESFKILYTLTSYNQELESFVRQCLAVHEKTVLLKILQESPYQYSNEFKNLIGSI